VYATTTNPTIATGDGIAMAYRAKAQVQDMEFMQFHPTALYMPGQYPSFLISEAVRGHGAILVDASGTPFMQRFDPRESLAPPDIVARAIDAECKRQGAEHMWLDCRAMGRETLLKEFPTIYARCLSLGIDAATALVPVAPAAHYLVGGIRVDANGQTSIRQLYACGECASTGLHGANRLASNSLLEALVFAHRAYKHAIAANAMAVELPPNIPDWDSEGTTEPKELVLINQTRAELQRIMANYVGIVRTDARLAMAFDRLALLHAEVERLYKTTRLSVPLLELRNLVNTAYLIVRCAQVRHESRGLHYTLSWPAKLPEALHTIL
jgi:L-aspartate oxidase